MKTLSAKELKLWNAARENVAEDVESERRCHLEKWGIQKHPPEVWLAILSEEVGEMAEALLNLKFNTFPIDVQSYEFKVRHEAIQIAAVASAIAQYIDEEQA